MIPHADSLVGSPPLPLRLYIAAALGKYQHGPEVEHVLTVLAHVGLIEPHACDRDLVLAHEEGP